MQFPLHPENSVAETEKELSLPKKKNMITQILDHNPTTPLLVQLINFKINCLGTNTVSTEIVVKPPLSIKEPINNVEFST